MDSSKSRCKCIQIKAEIGIKWMKPHLYKVRSANHFPSLSQYNENVDFFFFSCFAAVADVNRLNSISVKPRHDYSCQLRENIRDILWLQVQNVILLRWLQFKRIQVQREWQKNGPACCTICKLFLCMSRDIPTSGNSVSIEILEYRSP